MKLTKKILVAVLAIACLASCFLFSSFADDQVAEPTNPFRAIGISKIDDILEYYMHQVAKVSIAVLQYVFLKLGISLQFSAQDRCN